MTLKEIDLEATDKTDQMTNHVIPSDSDVLEDVVILPPQNIENDVSSSAAILLEVIAPENLPEGYTFNVTISGSDNIVAVTVPEGGVIAGQKFTTKVENLNPIQPKQTTDGNWKDGICACFKHGIFHPMVWNACCCTLVALGQVMTRLKLNWAAIPSKSEIEIKRTFEILLGITAFLLLSNWILGTIMLYEIEAHTDENNITTLTYSPLYEIINLVRNIMNFFSLVYTIYAITKTRSYIREKYSIEGSLIGDCCLAFWCGCCTITQMARHTTDYDVYPGRCCTYNGLPRNAPCLVEEDVVIDSDVVDGGVPIANAIIV